MYTSARLTRLPNLNMPHLNICKLASWYNLSISMTSFDLDSAIRKVPDFPKKGILFYDVTSLLSNPAAFKYIEEEMVRTYRGHPITKIIAIEARGFLFAPLLARALRIPIVLARKNDKLPNETYRAEYTLEYRTDVIEIQRRDMNEADHILIVDDLIATGGTVEAVCDMVSRQARAKVFGIFCLIGLPFLNYAERLAGHRIDVLIEYKEK